MKSYHLGDSCLCWSLSDKIEKDISTAILAVYRRLKQDNPGSHGILDVVPSYNALAVHFDPLSTDSDELRMYIDKAFTKPLDSTVSSGKTVEIPVKYDGEDLQRVADLHGISIEEVIRLHKNSTFTVAMVGFLPNFPYLIGLDERLITPRLDSPRVKVPAGAVAIGGAQTGIYPVESPGGWNLIGSTEPVHLRLLEPGDTVIMKEVQ